MTATETPPPPLSAIPRGTYCPDCRYDLRGSTSPRCSECGFDLELVRTRESLIPWTHRRERGRLRAYWQTVEFVLRKPKLLCLEAAARPVSYADARSFRWVTWGHAAGALVVLTAVFMHDRAFPAEVPQGWVLGSALFVLLALAALAPGVASYFFQPRRLETELQNRAIALSYYAWAPLAFLPLVTLLGAGFWLAARLRAEIPGLLLALFAMVLLPLIVFGVELRLLEVVWRLLGRSFVRAVLRIALFNLALIALTVLLLVFPLGLFWLAIVWHSVH